MMDELKDVKRVLNPTEVLLVVDAMTGQEAAGLVILNFNYSFWLFFSMLKFVTFCSLGDNFQP